MKKGLRIAATAVGVIIILMFLLPFTFQGKIADIVKTEGNKMFSTQFDLKNLNISPFRNFPQASVTLEDFWLKGTGELANDTLAQAGGVTATVNLFSLFGDSGYDISKIFIEDIRLHAIVLPDGRADWDTMKLDTTATAEAPVSEEEVSSPFKVKLQRFVIKNMNLTYGDQQGKMYTDICDFNVVHIGDSGSDRATLKLEAETKSLTYKMNGAPFLVNINISATTDVDVDFANNKYTLEDNTIRPNAIWVGIDGRVALKDPAIGIDLKLNANDIGFKEILPLIPAIHAMEFPSLKTDGTATLTATAKGTSQGGTVPTFNIDMQIKNAMFRHPALPVGVDQINISANIQDPGGNIDLTMVNTSPFSFRLVGNPFSLTASVKVPISDPDFKTEAKGILNLGMIKQVYPLGDMELNGTVDADMQMLERLPYIEKEEYERMQAPGTIGSTGMRLKMKDIPDVKIRKSLFTFTPKYLQLSETTVNIEKNDITADSRFENYIGYALKGTTLKGNPNTRSNYFNLNDFMAASADEAIASETTSTDSVTTVTTGIMEVPRSTNFQMDANLKQVLFDKMSLNSMNGKFVVKDGKVDMKNLSMNTMGGNVVMGGHYLAASVKKPETKAGFKFSNTGFAQAYEELDMAQKMAPIFENLRGNSSGSISVLTDLDATMSPVLNIIQGDDSLSTRDLSLSGVKAIDEIADAVKQPSPKDMKVKDMTPDLTIKDGRVETKPFDIKMGDYTLNLSGSTGLDQTIGYSGKVRLSVSVGNVSKLMIFDLKIGGSFTSPKVSVDTKSMANQVAEVVADEAISRLGQKLGPDSVAIANKDSIKQEMTEKAAEKALDFLKKKLK